MKKRVLAAFAALMIIFFSAVPVGTAAFSGADRIVIVLDPGHGGKDPGADAGGVYEKNLTLKLAGLIRDRLSANGSFAVYMTRTGDTYLSLAERGIYADSVNADLLISIHFDSADGNPSKNGVTAYTSVLDKYALISLSSSVTSSVASAAGMNSNGVERKKDTDGYYWNSEKQWDIKGVNTGTLSDYYGIPTWCAKFGIMSTIIEHGFMSNASDFKKITASGTLEKMADAEASAIISYYTNHAHSYGSTERDFPSNCTFQGKQSRHCTVCGHRTEISYLEAAPGNHFWINEKTTPASCGKNGSVYHECRITLNLNDKGYPIQNHTETAVIPAPRDHDYEVTETVAATHTEDGYKQFRCRSCGYTFKDILKAEGHSYEFVKNIDATCTVQGGKLYRCTKCSAEYVDGPPAPGHSYEMISEKKPTCTEAGLKEYKCKKCSEKYSEEVPALGHDMKVISEKAATCTDPGEKVTGCTRCKEQKTEVLKKLSHNYLMTAYTPGGCTEKGSVEFVCEHCGEKVSGELEAVAHSWAEKENTPARLFSGGRRTEVCINCGKTESFSSKAIFLTSPVYPFAAASAVILLASLVIAAIFLPRILKKGTVTAEEVTVEEAETEEEEEEPEKEEQL